MHLDHPRRVGIRLVVKELFGRTAAAAALVLLAPVFAVIAVAIKAADGGPVFFRQIRVGGEGEIFFVWNSALRDGQPLVLRSTVFPGVRALVEKMIGPTCSSSPPRTSSTATW